MRLGFCPAGRRHAADLIETVLVAERAGLDEVWLAEDYLERGAFTVAGAAALATSRVAIGLGVVNAWTRHPALLAMELAALQELAPGRITLGLGTGNRYWMADLLGLPFEAPLSQLVEAAEIVTALMTRGTVDHRGRFFSVAAEMAFGAPGLDNPLMFGVKGPRALEAAGRLGADVLLPVAAGPRYVEWARERAGPQARISSYVIFRYDSDRRRARDASRPAVAAYLGMHGANAVTRCAGVDPELAERFSAAWRAGRAAAELVDDEILDAVAVVGDEHDCRAGLARLAAAGVSSAILGDEADVDAAAQIMAFVNCHPRGLTEH